MQMWQQSIGQTLLGIHLQRSSRFFLLFADMPAHLQRGQWPLLPAQHQACGAARRRAVPCCIGAVRTLPGMGVDRKPAAACASPACGRHPA